MVELQNRSWVGTRLAWQLSLRAKCLLNSAPSELGVGRRRFLSGQSLAECRLAIPAMSAVLPNGVADIPWNQRTWEQKTDPFVWAYSQAFADRFGMPNEWVDPNLKGALAIAWRTTSIGQMSCGYGGDPNACWPPFTCQMDIYVDSDAPIPWRFNDVTRDFLWDGLSSLDFVPKRMPAPRRFRYAYTAGALGSVGLPFYTEGGYAFGF
eukprot:gene31122-38459_t